MQEACFYVFSLSLMFRDKELGINHPFPFVTVEFMFRGNASKNSAYILINNSLHSLTSLFIT